MYLHKGYFSSTFVSKIRGPGHKLIIAVAILVVALSVGYYFVIYFPKYQEEQLSQQKNEQVAGNNFSNQEKCATASASFFDKWNQGFAVSISDGYVSHFNQSLDECFVELSKGMGNGTFYELADAVAGIEYAEIDWLFPSTSENNPSWCTIYPNGNVTDSVSKNCNSKTEFDSFVKPYMSN